MFLRNGGDAFSLQKLLGHSSLDVTRRYAELAQADVVAKHRAAYPTSPFHERGPHHAWLRVAVWPATRGAPPRYRAILARAAIPARRRAARSSRGRGY